MFPSGFLTPPPPGPSFPFLVLMLLPKGRKEPATLWMEWSLSSPEFPAWERAAERTQGSSGGSTPIGAGIKGEADTDHHLPTCPQDEVQQHYRLPGDICLWIPDALGCGRGSQK